MKLIDNWRRFYRMVSVQCMALAGAVQTTWELIPPELKLAVPPKYVYAVTMTLLVVGILGRLVKQKTTDSK